MRDKPKLPWFQFSLRTIFVAMTLVAAGSAVGSMWLSHRAFCLKQWNHHRQAYGKLMGEPEFQSGSVDYQSWKVEAAERAEHRERQANLASAYRRAVWLPWERLWIDDTPPDETS